MKVTLTTRLHLHHLGLSNVLSNVFYLSYFLIDGFIDLSISSIYQRVAEVGAKNGGQKINIWQMVYLFYFKLHTGYIN